MPPTPRTAALARAPLAERILAPSAPALLAAPPVAPPVVDEGKEDRVRFIVQQLAACLPEKDVVREVVRCFAVPKDQAILDFADAKDGLRQRLDDEGAIDGVMYGALARINNVQEEFYTLALAPVPQRIREVPAPLPADPLEVYDADGPGSTWRSLTPGEYAAAIGAKVQAGKLALAANETLAKITGRRSTRWHDRPQNVIVAAGGDGFTTEDREFLKSIGALK
jgi:hypothetical protein